MDFAASTAARAPQARGLPAARVAWRPGAAQRTRRRAGRGSWRRRRAVAAVESGPGRGSGRGASRRWRRLGSRPARAAYRSANSGVAARPRRQRHFARDGTCTLVIGLPPTGRATTEALQLNRAGPVGLRRCPSRGRASPARAGGVTGKPTTADSSRRGERRSGDSRPRKPAEKGAKWARNRVQWRGQRQRVSCSGRRISAALGCVFPAVARVSARVARRTRLLISGFRVRVPGGSPQNC